MYNPISNQFLHNLKKSRNFARKKCTAPLVGRLAPIFLAVENVEKRGAPDPAGWSRVGVMCVAQVLSFIGSETDCWIRTSRFLFQPMQRTPSFIPISNIRFTKIHDYEKVIFFP